MSLTVQGISLKIFIGFIVNSELRMHLMNSKTWKEMLIVERSNKNALKLVRYGDKEYWGCYIPHLYISLDEIPSLEAELQNALKVHCPQIKKSFPLYIFSQSFIH